MKFIIKKTGLFLADSYSIVDEDGNKPYMIKKISTAGRQHCICDSKGVRLANVIQNLNPGFAPCTPFVIDAVSKRYRFTSKFVISWQYWLEGSSWNIAGNWSRSRFTVSDGDSIIMSMRKEGLHYINRYYVLDVPNPDHVLLSLCILIIIDGLRISTPKDRPSIFYGKI